MTALKEKILRIIRETGPMSVAQYMALALGDPILGYYKTRDPLGRDFVTAPEVSQMFGELIGLFFVQAWEDRGRPQRFYFLELGPGRGTLMADMLRAAHLRPAFGEAAEIVLLETSQVLRAVQERTLKGIRVQWIDTLDALDDSLPIFAVANEFLDALPVEQFVKTTDGWHARAITADGDMLRFGLAEEDVVDAASIPVHFRDAPEGSICELGMEAVAMTRHLSSHTVRSDGIALIIDYGAMRTMLGDTFQAVKTHRFADPLTEPGEADLTFHVDFAALAETACRTGASVFGPVIQGTFLEALGIGLRAQRLKQAAPEQASEIDAALNRLTDPKQMGALFKVMAITSAGFTILPGFPC